LKGKICTKNKVEDIKKFVNDNGYYADINPKEFFIFGADVGNGTEENHLQIGFTSTELMSRIPSGVVYHCDATYKIVKIGFPLVIFGMSDINRKFYSLAFAFTSHEQHKDFCKFFINLKKLAIQLNIVFDPKFMCIDASKSLAFAINTVFPHCVLLMCWFHLKYNVINFIFKLSLNYHVCFKIRKRKHKIVQIMRKFLNQISQLHHTTDQLDFNRLWKEISRTWLKNSKLKPFHTYFEKQWIKSKFNKWAVFHSPPGFTTTNNPIESYNKSIKAFFTNNLKLNLVPVFEVFQNLVFEESSIKMNYETVVKVTKTLENKSKKLNKLKFIKNNSTEYLYNHTNGQTSFINLLNNSFTCTSHIDKGICLHLIHTARLENIVLPGMVIVEKFTVRNRRKKDKKKTLSNSNLFEINESDEEINDDYREINDASQELIDDFPVVEAQLPFEIPKKRGRPPKNKSALVIEDIERPKMVDARTSRRIVIEDIVERPKMVALRSSRRIAKQNKK
jgi:hypothetical protein